MQHDLIEYKQTYNSLSFIQAFIHSLQLNAVQFIHIIQRKSFLWFIVCLKNNKKSVRPTSVKMLNKQPRHKGHYVTMQQ